MNEGQPWRRTSWAAVGLLGVLSLTISSGRLGPRQHRMGDRLVATSWPTDQALALAGITLGIAVAAVLAVLAVRRRAPLLARMAFAVGAVAGIVALGPITGFVATALFGYALRPTLRG